MFARTLVTGLVAVATSSAIALTAGPASAALTTDPDDTTGFTPGTTDIIGVGSDTSQHALKLLADAYNADGADPPALLLLGHGRRRHRPADRRHRPPERLGCRQGAALRCR